ncbi:SDR family oxidoreductase [Bacillus sp. MUM 13]|uniref:SDR family oxidoreductase n=1 Tax=Bacillus sp. MUM 13 TaxID=1678001 RepID=UPI0008F5F0A0|nr:SDR family oxidoreductase [Bacillus sp. MUM 13]OIK09274.1 oxidoreductase [Bacillus sp. MUM 13]
MYYLNDKTAIITGVSHDKGIGAEICRRFAKEGADIFFTHWSADIDWPESFQKEIKNYGVRCNHAEIDLSHPDAAAHIMDRVSAVMNFPQILINNAAHSVRDSYKELNAKILDDTYAVNMRSTFLLCTEFARRLKDMKNASGRIINMTSGQALGPMVNELAYAATKGAISAFTVSLSAELAPLGITVNAINPGPTDTGWMTGEIKEQLLPKFLSGRMGKPEDAARLAAFLASEEAQWITGQILNSEGGFLRS